MSCNGMSEEAVREREKLAVLFSSLFSSVAPLRVRALRHPWFLHGQDQVSSHILPTLVGT